VWIRAIKRDIFEQTFIYNYINASITTNTTINTVSNLVSVNELAPSFAFNIFPNPVKDQARVPFHLSAPGKVQLDLYDSMGKLVKSLSESFGSSGLHEIGFSTSELA